ncbi:hypothetical protein [Hankyongella ginsenosidimutans]|uniref:hypothetical protein n=1 Tax=Hankyongella ginsenosidimutans TaxID=1763828 RepID=UPI001CA35FAE
MLLVTHDFGDVLKLADHLVLMQGGTVTDSGPLAEVAQRLPHTARSRRASRRRP